MKIKESELILNPDGSIYHLNLMPENISDNFQKLRPVRYKAKPGFGDDREHIGFIAEEVEELFPEFVTYDLTAPLNKPLVTGLAFDRMISILIKELQTLKQIYREECEITTQLKQKLEINI